MNLEVCTQPLYDKMDRNLFQILDHLRFNLTHTLVFATGALQGAQLGDMEHMHAIALRQDGPVMERVRASARAFGVAIALGYLEKEDNRLFISQVFIDDRGEVLCNYRRACVGFMDEAYFLDPDGPTAPSFVYQDKTFVFATGDDLFRPERIDAIRELYPDVVLWSLCYNDYARLDDDETKDLLEAGIRRCGGRVVLVGAPAENDGTLGGAAYYHNGEALSGQADNVIDRPTGVKRSKRRGLITGYAMYCDLDRE